MGSKPIIKVSRRKTRGKVITSLSKKLKDVEWGSFKLGDIFVFKAIKQAKSQKAIPTDNTVLGIPYIVQSTTNNMFARNVNKQWLIDNNEAPVSGNRIVLGVTLPAVSYQPTEFGASQVITATAEWLNEKNGNFVAIVISKLMHQFSYNNKPGLQIYKDMVIELPIRNGNIDVDFMECFMSEIEEERIIELELYLKANSLKDYNLTDEEQKVLDEFDNMKWGEFRLGDLFERIKTNKLPFKADDLPKEPIHSYVIPCLTSSFQNQGLNYFVTKDNATILKNVISIPSNSDVYRAYFQSREFTVLSDAYAIEWIYNEVKLSPNQYLFTVPCINKVTDLSIYSYKNKLGGWNVVQNKNIELPIKNNQPDYKTMETLISAIKKLMIKDVIDYVNKKKIVLYYLVLIFLYYSNNNSILIYK